jgi:hypothetical protein
MNTNGADPTAGFIGDAYRTRQMQVDAQDHLW